MSSLRGTITISLLCLALLACSTDRGALVLQDDPVRRAETEDLSLTIRFQDEPALIERFGKENNPFLTPRFVADYKRIVVFLVEGEAKRPAGFRIKLGELELQFGDRAESPTNATILTRYWELRDKADDVHPRETRRKGRLIKNFLMKDYFIVEEGSLFRGFVVFRAKFPRYGEAELFVPILDGSNQPIEVFEFTYQF